MSVQVSAKNSSLRILLIDDEPDLLEEMSYFLMHRGHRVECATCAEQAMALLHPGAFDLLITDVRMPGIDGVQLSRAAADTQAAAHLVLITGHWDDAGIEHLKGVAYQVLKKPFTLLQLQRLIDPLLARGRPAT